MRKLKDLLKKMSDEELSAYLSKWKEKSSALTLESPGYERGSKRWYLYERRVKLAEKEMRSRLQQAI